MESSIKDKDGKILNEMEKVQCRWGEYFEDLLNNSEARKAVVSTLSMVKVKLLKNGEHNGITANELVAA